MTIMMSVKTLNVNYNTHNGLHELVSSRSGFVQGSFRVRSGYEVQNEGVRITGNGKGGP